MIPYNEFYSAYLSNHFKIKSKLAAYWLNLNQESLQTTADQLDLKVNDIEFLKTIKLDLLQTFYQSVESLFGLMHSLEKVESNSMLPDYLVNAGIGELHKYIAQFRNFEYCEQYLISDLQNDNADKIPKYKWLFYFITIFYKGVPQDFLNKVENLDNIKGIAWTLHTLANMFNKEAHNAIKHGLRCLIVDRLDLTMNFPEGIEPPEPIKNINIDNEMLMYYTKRPIKNGPADVVLVPFDVKYLIFMEDGNSKLLRNLINHRQIVFGTDKPEEVFAHFFSYKNLEEKKPSLGNFQSIRVSVNI